MVGFNRRFSPHTLKLKEWLRSSVGCKAVLITVNAGLVPQDHWTQDISVGGGRIAGEACHFIDLARFLVGHPIIDSSITYLGGACGKNRDCATIQLAHQDGSTSTIQYLSNGHKAFPKERVEVFANGDILSCDNFRTSRSLRLGKHFKTRSQDKGHQKEMESFVNTICSGGSWPIPAEELLEVSRIAIELAGRI